MASTKAKQAATMKSIRQALADYMASEGCSCCCNRDAHDEAKAILAKLLEVPKYSEA